MQYTDDVLHQAHRAAYRNEESLRQSDSAGCFYCRQVFDRDGIKMISKWADGLSEDMEKVLLQAGDLFSGLGYYDSAVQKIREDAANLLKKTGLCPKCGIDSLIGSASGFPVTDPTFLQAMHSRWFRMSSGGPAERQMRDRLIAEAKEAGRGYVLLPAQTAENIPERYRDTIDPAPESLYCLGCRRTTYEQTLVKSLQCSFCGKEYSAPKE
jgi:hypothetical protein